MTKAEMILKVGLCYVTFAALRCKNNCFPPIMVDAFPLFLSCDFQINFNFPNPQNTDISKMTFNALFLT